MSAGHSHAHGHASAESDRRWLIGALLLIVAYMIGEVTAGVAARSLALISDAAHMLTDAGSIALALYSIRLAARPASGFMTYGWKRVEILSAQVNGLALLLLAVWLADEAIRRLIRPPQVTGSLVLATALVGIVVNVAATVMIGRANRASLNVEGAFQHILNDLFAFVATAVAGVIMLLTKFWRADAIATLIVVALMARAGFGLLAASVRVFMEAAPKSLDPAAVGRAMAGCDAVVEVHDLHIWEITSGSPALSAHVLVADGTDCHSVRADLARLLDEQHGIRHTTLEVDHVGHDAEHHQSAPASPHCEQAHGPVHRSPPPPDPTVTSY